MSIPRSKVLLLLVGLATTLVACDLSEQNYDYRPGDSLAIVGPTGVEVGTTAEYYVRAFTIEKDYTWTVNGEAPDNVRRDGEFIDVSFPAAGVYTIEVTTTGGGDPGYTGTLEVTAAEPSGG